MTDMNSTKTSVSTPPIPARILLVEDEPTVQEMYVEILKEEGYNVVSSGDGQEALQYIQEGGYDLVLLDIMLPHIDGIHILEKLKTGSAPKKPNKAIVLLTNIAQEEVVSKGISLGIRGYLIKSNYNPGEFIKEVKNFLA